MSNYRKSSNKNKKVHLNIFTLVDQNLNGLNDQINFLVCHTVVTILKKYNLERHYQSCHGHYETK
jgi:hypothetical protein